jgi:RNA polymerase sigma-70 factor (ECF subfamily)
MTSKNMSNASAAAQPIHLDSHETPLRPAHVRRLTPAMDERELTQIYRQYRQQVFARCRRILRDDSAAEDATQTVFMKLWRYGESFRVADWRLGWLYRVAERCCFDELRRRCASWDGATIEDLSDSAHAVDGVEQRDMARRFLARFDERVKQVAVLRYCEEMSQDEIAEATRWSRQTVFKKLALVRERADALRASLSGERTAGRL